MGHSKAGNPRLGEVKAVLQRLQQIPDEPEPVGVEDGAQPGHASRHRLAIAAGVITAALALVLFGTYAFFNFHRLASATARPPASLAIKVPTDAAPGDTETPPPSSPASPPTAVQPAPPPSTDLPAPPTPQAALQVASGLMNSGRVQAARSELLRVASEGSADVALALARSYDPNFLRTVPADAAPDIAEATRWYRTWYAIAVKQGLVADSVPLERIIRSMR
jgi:hypothetical protein